MKTVMQNQNANQSIQYPRKNPETPEINKKTLLTLRYRTGTWHIFKSTHARASCICGSTKNRDYKHNHFNKKRTLADLLETPEEELGEISGHAQTWLKKRRQVKQP